ncbi:hypothetical protein [Actinocrispum wychmicini]|uniref:Uncharacterized protein n=1 Tax=Actinocrispum wychmicini TaxID=1213861 RepID=A0A4R2IS91_9PSEU|nr:hypothetical protein [Actinocrispum wychmicini]TCO47276.1 hypothetical protein EV192_11716 [Actinocrispum wychmicini]
MTTFFGELGRKLAEKWLSLLVMPGLLVLATAAVGATLGHSAPFDWDRLVRRADQWARAVGTRPAVAQIGLLAAVLLASFGVGLAVRALSGLTERLWLGQWWTPLARWGARRRAARWMNEQDPVRRNEISLARPARPTWMGDRLAASDVRVLNQYDVDLRAWWPRLWLVLDDPTRAELRAARAAFDDAATRATWAVGYLVTGLFWWPAGIVAVVVWITGWSRGRMAVRTYADLIESTVDLTAVVVARRLGFVGDHDRFTSEVGEALTAEFRKGT